MTSKTEDDGNRIAQCR